MQLVVHDSGQHIIRQLCLKASKTGDAETVFCTTGKLEGLCDGCGNSILRVQDFQTAVGAACSCLSLPR